MPHLPRDDLRGGRAGAAEGFSAAKTAPVKVSEPDAADIELYRVSRSAFKEWWRRILIVVSVALLGVL